MKWIDTSFEDDMLKPFFSMRSLSFKIEADQQRVHPFFIAEGKHVIEQAIALRLSVTAFCIVENQVSFLEKFDQHDFLKDIPCYVISTDHAKKLIGYKLHQGILALVKRPILHPLANLNAARSLWMVGLAKAENVGAVIRSSLALGVDHILFDEQCCTPFLRRAVKVSRGAVLHSTVYESKERSAMALQLKQQGYTLVALALGGRELKKVADQILACKRLVFVIGEEGSGLPQDVLDVCDFKVELKMDQRVDSLNVACALTACLYSLIE